jgi:hypothetical protein
MMKKDMKKFIVFLLLITGILLVKVGSVQAQQNQQLLPMQDAAVQVQATASDIPLLVCGCPSAELQKIYDEKKSGERCVTDYETFKQDPATNHLWVEDPEITAQGKADERARQFIYWAITHNSIDNHPTLLKIWSTARNVAYFFVLLVGAIMGLGMIVAQRNNFSTSVKVWPTILKIIAMLLFITFSASLVITIIQLSEILMKFFIENLGGKDLFNIYFGTISQEPNYTEFIGCRDLNIRVQEGVQAELMILKITNISYYVMGTMLILRKILLWFLLFVSPFLAILAPFVFIRNIAWIWVGVFFQWVFYGPLFALFLGALATIWRQGIPFIFDFSRINSLKGYIYPTAFNILYGGPAQHLAIINNGNYVDTFAEYVITLIMLWAVTFFPWWLLRIFRDYCCDGINAMKNILMSMYDQSRNPPSPGPTPIPAPTQTPTGTSLNIPTNVSVKLETIEEIKRTKTEDITKSLNISTQKLTDVARFETDKNVKENINKNINYLKNPVQATTSTERQKYMNIRTELFNRAVKNDIVAKQILSSISTSKVEQIQKRQEILKSVSHMVPATYVATTKVRAAIAAQKPGEKKVMTTTPAIPTTPEKPIEQIIAVPATVSIEEYEQVKKMWKSQYEKGEVPVQDNIKTREQWVEQDTIFITNTLNKLFSSNEELKQQGLDDLGYILPIFMISNMSGEQLVTYLKAKLEAAKMVKEEKAKEKEITEKLKSKTEEEFVEVPGVKHEEAEKTMEMKNELPIDEIKTPEDKGTT